MGGIMLASYKTPLHAAFLVVFYCALGSCAYAQSSSATLNGTVLDPSTFSGTHYVTPRALTAELGFHF
jgi:hypothetical protein